jgi:translation initiation factor 1
MAQNQLQNQLRSKSGCGPTEQDPKGRRTVFSTDPDDDQAMGNPGAPGAGGTNPAGPIATRQKNQPVIVGIERKGRGGKTVSIVAGVMSYDAGKLALLKLLKTKLGTGGTLKDDTIEIQGDHREQIVEILTGLGYKAKRSGG